MYSISSSTLFYLVSIALMSVAISEASYKPDMTSSWVPGFRICKFQDNTYAVGKSFHPIVKTGEKVTDDVCTVCTCNPTTLVQCTGTVCPNLTNCITTIKLSGECCERCFDEQKEPMQYCTDHGVKYEHGALFHPAVVENGSNAFCSSCKCDNGTINCQNVSSHCPEPIGCSVDEQYVPKGHCCRTCPIPYTSNGECLDERKRIRKDGESWSLYYNGKDASCWNCTCKNSSVTCQKPPCPPVPPCKPEDPIDAIVPCCPKCSRTPRNETSTSTSTSTTSSNSIVIPSPSITPIPGSCKDPKYTHKVYLCHEENGMAIEDTRNNTVQLYNWVQAGVKDIQYMTTKEFQLSDCAEKINYHGYALLRRVNGLTNKETKASRIENCIKKCAKLVVSMLRPTSCPE